MLLKMIYDEGLAQAAYLIGCQKTKEAIIIDPERDVDRYLDIAKQNGVRIIAAAETHIHADFLSGVRELAERCGATVYVSAEGGPDWQSKWFDDGPNGQPYPHVQLRHNDTFSIGNIDFKVLHTPGHTPEHISFVVTDRGGDATEPMGIVTGDFVFVGDVGRPDLLETAAGQVGMASDSADQLFDSITAFAQQPDYLQVWPAHGAGSACGKALGAIASSTTGYEKRFNPAFKAAQNRNTFTEYVLSGQPEPPLYFGRMKAQNRDGVPVLGGLPRPIVFGQERVRAHIESGGTVIDLRPWAEFRAGALRGALSVQRLTQLSTYAGSFIEDATTPIVLVVEPKDADEAIRSLVRVGYDAIVGLVAPSQLAQWTDDLTMTIDEISTTEAAQRYADGHVHLLDVRKATEYDPAHATGATNAVHTRMARVLDQLPTDKPIAVLCQGGTRSAHACALLKKNGIEAINVAGGTGGWIKAGCPTTRPEVDSSAT